MSRHKSITKAVFALLVAFLAATTLFGVRTPHSVQPEVRQMSERHYRAAGGSEPSSTVGPARLAANYESAVAVAADLIRTATDRDIRGIAPQVTVRPFNAANEADFASARALRHAVEQRGVPTTDADGTSDIRVGREEGTIVGSYLKVFSPSLDLDERIAFDMPADLLSAAAAGPNDFVASIRTGPALSDADSVEDAADQMRREVEFQLFRDLCASGTLDKSEESAFLTRFRGRYPRAFLLAQGVYRTRTVARVMDGQNFSQTYAIWRTPRARVARLGDAIASEMHFSRILPFIRGGLSVGALILLVLFWLRLDWWLKGHHSLLTKALCGILAIIGVGLIWSWPIHG